MEKTAVARINETAGCLNRLSSLQAKNVTNASLRAMRRRSESSSGAGRFRCSTVVERLRSEFVQQGRPEHFERLKVFHLVQSDAYAALAREMNTSEEALNPHASPDMWGRCQMKPGVN